MKHLRGQVAATVEGDESAVADVLVDELRQARPLPSLNFTRLTLPNASNRERTSSSVAYFATTDIGSPTSTLATTVLKGTGGSSKEATFAAKWMPVSWDFRDLATFRVHGSQCPTFS